MVAKMGIILTKKQRKKLREQEMQAQKYHIGQLYNFVHLHHGNFILPFLVKKGLQRFDMFDDPDQIIITLGPGIYIFFNNRKVRYIGSSKEMRKRIFEHIRNYEKGEKIRYIKGDRIITIKTEKKDKQLEGQLILAIQPERNKKKTWGVG